MDRYDVEYLVKNTCNFGNNITFVLNSLKSYKPDVGTCGQSFINVPRENVTSFSDRYLRIKIDDQNPKQILSHASNFGTVFLPYDSIQYIIVN